MPASGRMRSTSARRCDRAPDSRARGLGGRRLMQPKSFCSFIASIWLPVTLSLPAKKSCMPLACGFSSSFWKSSAAIVIVQSALPGLPFSASGPSRRRR